MARSAAEQKNELVARIFGETGFKELMLGIHRLGLKHEHPGKKIRNNNGEFISINPEEWRNRYDMDVTVGIGNGSKNQQMFQMQAIEQTIQSIVGSGGLGTLVTPTNIFEFAMEKVRVAGRKDGGKFFTKPESDDTDQGPSVEEQALQVQQEIAAKEIELKEAELVIKEREQTLKEQELAFKERVHEDENEFRLAELDVEIKQQRAVKIGDS